MRITKRAAAITAAGILSACIMVGWSLSWQQDASAEPKPNRLIHESSPYLRLHAHNPVDWYPWGEEAFQRARQQDKPIFLSVGYSTCHWCHVMERESFSDPEIAALMNRHFVNIKVDREERPDIDRVYMSFLQAATGGGGWPMSIFLTPDRKPFFGGTYYPPADQGGRPGFVTVINRVRREWVDNRQKILTSADRITQALQEMAQASGGGLKLERRLLDRAYQAYAASFDSLRGGFGSAPKFPRPVNFNFLLRYHSRTGEEKALEMTLVSLRAMARGGMYDHLGGGFHRYSTDADWFLPHFEKMLYDQAQLAIAYLEAYQLSGDPSLAEAARGIFGYVLRDMTSAQGGFYSAEDADSPLPENPEDHGEGAFYAWKQQEIDQLLGAVSPLPQLAEIFRYRYGVKPDGNVKKDPFREFQGKNILYQAAGLEETADNFEIPAGRVSKQLEQARQLLFQARSKRPRPPLDDKVLTAWNGLMISAFARGYQVLRDARYLEASRKAARFIQENLYDSGNKRLKRRYRQGDADIAGMLSDYAFLIQGLIDLYEASLQERWLLWALDLTESQVSLFQDAPSGGFFNTTDQDPSVLFRIKEDYDGAEPSPNSVSALNLLRLAEMTHNESWRQLARKNVQAFEKTLSRVPQAMPQMLAAVDFLLDKPRQIIIAGHKDAADTRSLVRQVHKRFLPRKILLLADGGTMHQRLSESQPALKGMRPLKGKATAYICRDYLCDLPTSDPNQVARLLGR